jgi:hypothetical protein
LEQDIDGIKSFTLIQEPVLLNTTESCFLNLNVDLLILSADSGVTLSNIELHKSVDLTEKVKGFKAITAVIIDPHDKAYLIQEIDTKTLIYLKENFRVNF